MLDWDSAASFDFARLQTVLLEVRRTGEVPEWVDRESREVGNVGVGGDDHDHGLSKEVLEMMERGVRSWYLGIDEPSPLLSSSHSHLDSDSQRKTPRKIIILEGILLFPPHLNPPLSPLLTLRILLTSTLQDTKTRRQARSGYVTAEGFWVDPPDYVEKVVWPNYVLNHGFLFEGGDVEGRVRGDVVREHGIEVCPRGEGKGSDGEMRKEAKEGQERQWDVKKTLAWVLSKIKKALEEGDAPAGRVRADGTGG